MPRIARKDLNTSFIHVMVQGVNKQYIFYKDEYIERYLEIINKYKDKYNFTILAYCIMNNHAHFLVYTEDINDFGRFMQKINLIYAQMYNREEKRCGVLFRNRYQTEPIYDMKYLINCINYIHMNPVKAKIVLKCEDYKYSSYKDYVNNTGVTKSKIAQEIFGSDCDYRNLFNEAFEKRFMDVEDENVEHKEKYILEGVNKFKREYSIGIVDIISNRDLFKELIRFLKNECGLKYVEIREYFEIPRGTMDILKIR